MRLLVSLLAIPVLAQQAVDLYAPEKERAMGQRYLAEIRKESVPFENPVVAAYVRQTGSRLARELSSYSVSCEFEIISDSERTEPLPLPGGFVVLPVQFFIVAKNEAEFAGTLAHAIAHVALKHGTRTVSRAPLIFTGGWMGPHYQTLVPIGSLQAQRTYELEADELGLQITNDAGYDPTGFVRYIERSQPADSPMFPFPYREVRLSEMRRVVSSLSPRPPASSGDEFGRVQQLVRVVLDRSVRN